MIIRGWGVGGITMDIEAAEPRILRRPAILRLPIQGILLSCFMASCPAIGQAQEARLVVRLSDIRDDSGQLRVSLYRDPESFRKEDRALQIAAIPAVPGAAEVVFSGLEPGRYAVMAYHDTNGNGRLDLRFGMFPLEGYGLSNNPKVVGPPKFADSAFEVTQSLTSVNIRISY